MLSQWKYRVRAVSFAGLLLTAAWAAGQTGGPDPAAQPPVFVLELGFLDRTPDGGVHATTALGLTVEGVVYLPQDAGQPLAAVDRMRPEQVASLLQEIETSGRLHEMDSRQLRQQLEAACQAAGFAFEIEGAAETVIRCHANRGLHEVRCPALSVMAARFPDFPAVQRLLAIQLRLQNVAAVARAGGEPASHRLAETANRTLQLSHPNLPPLTPRDLSMVRELQTGHRYVQFYRAPTGAAEELLVSLFESPGAEPRVSVLMNPTAQP